MTLWTECLGAEIKFVDVAGVRTRCVIAGSGPEVLLLHGRGGHLETWGRNIAALAARHTVVAPDLLGHGLTSQAESGYTISDLADHIVALLDVLGFECVDLVGQSIGGWVAAWLAHERPERVGNVVLVATAGLQSEQERLADPAIKKAYEEGGRAFETPTIDAVRHRLGLLIEGAPDDEMVMTRWRLYQPAAAREVHRLVRSADNSAFLLTPELLANITSPVLVVQGERGNTPLAVVRAAINYLADARLEVLPGAKQWPQWERAELFNALANDFLRRRQQ